MADALDVTILDSGSPGRVVAVARCASDLAIVRLSYNGELQTLLNFRDRIDRALRGLEKRPRVQELTDYGHQLFSFCVRDGLAQLYNRLPADHVRLHIFSDRAKFKRSLGNTYKIPLVCRDRNGSVRSFGSCRR